MRKKVVCVRSLAIGEGRPKICVPLVAENRTELAAELTALKGVPFDLVEWRADYFKDLAVPGGMEEAARRIRETIGNAPVLFTLRTRNEGGLFSTEKGNAQYEEILLHGASLEETDLVDVELFTAGEEAAHLTEKIRKCGCAVIGSSHDFAATPSVEEMRGRLIRMQQAGMDITKLAVTPVCRLDVIRLMEATAEMEAYYADRPFITMSMGSLGSISRVSGSLTGSAVTFGTVHAASAPGQLPARELAGILELLRI